MKARHLLIWILLAVWIAGAPGLQAKKKDEPDVVAVQHILIGFKKSIRGKELERTKKEAQALAEELLDRARAGEEFDALVKEYTDERYPGIYRLTNFDAPLMQGAHERKGMVANFGQVAFSLEVGEVGLAKFHPANSPYGWHVIKRLE
jgi:parvulin-like peptidyl-prolyl isomerase